MLWKNTKLSLVWGSLLILLGLLALLDQFVELSPWVWAGVLAVVGLGALGLYLADRSDWLMLLSAYILCAIALLIALVPSEILRDEAVAVYVLAAIALPFLAVYLLNRRRWWALIPGYVLLAIALLVGVAESGIFGDELITAYVLLVIALPFFVVYARNRKQWWALIPGGILAVIGLAFLLTETVVQYAGAIVLVVVGAWFLVRAFARREPQ